MLLATDVSNTTVFIKNCSYETAIDSARHDVVRDDSDPTDCANQPSSLVPSTTARSTVTSTTTETTTFIETSTETTTSSITITFTGMSTVTQYSTYWSSTKASIAPTESTTENMTAEVTTDSLVATQPVENAITTISQINTVTVVDSSLVVSTVTETQVQAYETSTADVTGSCTPRVLYAYFPCPKERVQTVVTTIQSSCVSLQVNDTIASSSTGITGFIGSDGIMRATVCREVIVVTPDPAAEQEAVESIVKELTVDKKNISALVKKKVSAQDKRSSSVAIGFIGIVFLIIPFLLIIAVDLPTCIQGGRNVIKLCKDEERF
ncbi:uncharacterized protein LOC126814282 [Patella vulgata]|uniref:uncharacterized protein LOC126814282 n=1 Tax=Patella vulgata TaxID=6465 RepID=UPI0021809897|nr:uncharacterized protein LOC126814282 [Patella vulgata]